MLCERVRGCVCGVCDLAGAFLSALCPLNLTGSVGRLLTLSGMAALCSAVSEAATLRSLARCSADMAGLCHRPSVKVGRKEAAVMGGRRRTRDAMLDALDMAEAQYRLLLRRAVLHFTSLVSVHGDVATGAVGQR